MTIQHQHPHLAPHEALVNITWQGFNGDLQDPVPHGATDTEIRAWVVEALQSGAVAGIPATRRVQLADHIVDRFPATAQTPYHRIFVRPITPFG